MVKTKLDIPKLDVAKIREIAEREKEHLDDSYLCRFDKPGYESYGVCIMGAVALDAGYTKEELNNFGRTKGGWPDWDKFGEAFKKYGFQHDVDVGVLVGVNDGSYDIELFGQDDVNEFYEKLEGIEGTPEGARLMNERVNERLRRGLEQIEEAQNREVQDAAS